VVRATAWVDQASSLLVLGSSLHVFSGRRFVVRASQAGLPIVIVNQGPTRADELATVKVDAPLGATLSAIARHCRLDGASAGVDGSAGRTVVL
jgi:NAD-dependent SIR2 family protein deacetylase